MRLFVAVDFPDSVKTQLVALKTNIPTARWVGRDQMHLTLFFIGETDRVQAVQDALAGVKSPPFTLTMQGVGRFPLGEKKPPRVLWGGLAEQPALIDLHRQVTAALAGLGFEPEDRAFSPHITLARLKTERPSTETSRFIETHKNFHIDAIPVTAFALYSSTLTPQGAQYRHVAVYPLLG